MNWVELPSETVINADNVAFIQVLDDATDGRYGAVVFGGGDNLVVNKEDYAALFTYIRTKKPAIMH